MQNGLVDAEDSISVAVARVEPPQSSIFGGEAVTVAGYNIEPWLELRVAGTVVATEVLSSHAVTFKAPSHARGNAEIAIALPDGRRGGCSDCLEYILPNIQLAS